MSDNKWTTVKRLVEAEIDKAKTFIGKATEEFKHVEEEYFPSCDCSGEIPTPCWLPKDLGDREVDIEAGGAAVLVVRVRNTDGQARNVSLQVSGTGASLVVPASASASVPAYGHASFTFTVNVPSPTPAGTFVDAQIVIQGCRRHILNWRVDVVAKCEPDNKTAVDVYVADGADYIHHWYDHFYCRRPCAVP